MPQKTAEQVAEFWVIWGIISPFVTFVLGFLVSRFTLSKADKVSADQAKFAVASELSKAQNEAYQALSVAFAAYLDPKKKNKKPKLDEFMSISQAAQNFLYQERLVADAILAGRVDETSRDKTLMKSLKNTAERTIPKVYETLHEIATKHNLPYPKDYDPADYQSIFEAVKKHG